jgi:hypothetical protein
MNMQMICRQPVGKVSMDPADAECLLDDEALKKKEPESIRKKERPTDKGVAWLVKTQCISPFSLESAKQELCHKTIERYMAIYKRASKVNTCLEGRELWSVSKIKSQNLLLQSPSER